MNSSAPKIGFDRFIQLDWAAAALNVRAGVAGLDDLNALLDAAELGVEAKKKTRTVLNRLWLEPRAELVDYADRGVAIHKTQPDIPVAALCWGMSVATYPFFGKVAELVGRLSAIQGDCASAEVHRRMSETYGEREGTRRMTNMVIQSQASWGAVERVEKGKRVIRLPPDEHRQRCAHCLADRSCCALRRQARFSAQSAVAARAVPVHLDAAPGLRGVEQPEPRPPVGRPE
jgi:hypothetical protein